MDLNNAKKIIKTQIELGMSSYGRMLSKEAISYLDSCLSDEKNLSNYSVECMNCGMVQSILLIENGCSNCGCLDIDAEVKNKKLYNFFKNPKVLNNWVLYQDSKQEVYDTLLKVLKINEISDNYSLDIKDCIDNIFQNDDNASEILFYILKKIN